MKKWRREGFEGMGQPVPYRTSLFAIALFSGIVGGAAVVFSTLQHPDLKDQPLHQGGIWLGVSTLLVAVLTPSIRWLEARAARKREESGLPPRVLRDSPLVLWFGMLLFGGSGLGLLWAAVHQKSAESLGAALGSLMIGFLIAKVWWVGRRGR